MIRVINLDDENIISFDKACNTYCLKRFLVEKDNIECFIVFDRLYNSEKRIYYLVSNVSHEIKRTIYESSARHVIKLLLSEGYKVYVDNED